MNEIFKINCIAFQATALEYYIDENTLCTFRSKDIFVLPK